MNNGDTRENEDLENEDEMDTQVNNDEYVSKSEFQKLQNQIAYMTRTQGKSGEKTDRPKTESKGDELTRDEVKLIQLGYDDEAIAFINKNGGLKALEDPFVKTALETRKAQKQAEQSVKLDGESGVSYNGKSAEEMTFDEYTKANGLKFRN